MRNGIAYFTGLSFAFALAGPLCAQERPQDFALTLRGTSCRECHGATGNSSRDSVPRINGQLEGYLRARLQSFRYPVKESPHGIHNMGIPGQQLTDAVVEALAAYYAAQKPFSGGLVTNQPGASIYKNGTHDIPACQGCHGAKGEGMGTAPRLAGQHRAYLQMQLQAFSTGARISDPMTRHVWFISPDQAMAVANYLGR